MVSKKAKDKPDPSKKPDSPDKVKQQLQRHTERQRKARIMLRHVDTVLRSDGVEAAIKELMQVRLESPLNGTIRMWLRDYRDMLDAWQHELMPEVVDEFYEYGFRRACDLALKCAALVKQERKIAYYYICERVLKEMAERSRLAISDLEDDKVEIPEPQMMSLEEVPADQIRRGTKL